MDKKIRLVLVIYKNTERRTQCFGEYDSFQEAAKAGSALAELIMGKNSKCVRFWMEEEGLWEDFGYWSKFLLYMGATMEDIMRN